jgi:hypothetical protein
VKKNILALAVLQLCSLAAISQYWQQETNYTINVKLNDKAHTLTGDLKLDYINNSPDTLSYIWFHLWPNAYKNENTAYAKQILKEADGRKRWDAMTENGSIDALAFSVNGQSATIEADPNNIDVIKVVLPQSLLPKQQVTITTPFTMKIPTYASRSGHLDQSYIICQWYPKPAVYDRKGWHPIPYLDHGEFYSEYGRFNVNITVPATYVVAATGTLQNEDELKTYKTIGEANNKAGAKLKKYSTKEKNEKTLSFKGENIHDFAWFADKDFIIRYDTAALASGKIIDVFSYSYVKGNKNWDKSIGYIEDAVRRYSGWIGEYPYPVVQAVEGPKNVASGGMEYPMITLITSPDANGEGLDGVITHEVGHNWFYGILGSNERDHAWMDEGINSYYQFRYEADKYRSNSVFRGAVPEEIKKKELGEFQDAIYGAMTQIPMDGAIETPSADFPDKDKYAAVIYLKTAIWMFIVESSVGKEPLDKVIQSYYSNWKFKHPYPEDLKAEFEKVLNKSVDNLFQLLNRKEGF